MGGSGRKEPNEQDIAGWVIWLLTPNIICWSGPPIVVIFFSPFFGNVYFSKIIIIPNTFLLYCVVDIKKNTKYTIMYKVAINYLHVQCLSL